MLPFNVQFQPGQPVYEQVVYAVEKALVQGQLRPGDAFPSQRTLARELKMNPNTAQKIIARLKSDGVLVVEPGRGTFVAENYQPPAGAAQQLLTADLEELVVKAKRLQISKRELDDALRAKWNEIS